MSAIPQQSGSEWLAGNRSRPCPFYAQGNCVFSDSCSFLHSSPPMDGIPRNNAMHDLLYQLKDVLPHANHSSPETPELPLDLLSPVSSASLPLRGFTHFDDSGFIDTTNWNTLPPTSVETMTPPRSPLIAPKSTLHLVSSPFGSPSLRISSPTIHGVNGTVVPISPMASAFPSPLLQSTVTIDPGEIDMDELDSPTSYNAEKKEEEEGKLHLVWDDEAAGHTAVFLGHPPRPKDSELHNLESPPKEKSTPLLQIPSAENEDEWDDLPPPEPSPMLAGIDDPFAREPSPFLDGVLNPFASFPPPFISSTLDSIPTNEPSSVGSLSRDASPIPETIPEEDEEEEEEYQRIRDQARSPDPDSGEDEHDCEDEDDDSFQCSDSRRMSLPPDNRPSSSFSLSTERAEGGSSPSPSFAEGYDMDDTFGYGNGSQETRSRSVSPSAPPRPTRPLTPLYENAQEEAEIRRNSGSYDFIHHDPSPHSRTPSVQSSQSRSRRSSSRSSSRCSTPTPLPDLVEEDENNLSSDSIPPPQLEQDEIDAVLPLSFPNEEEEDDDSTASLAYMFSPPGLVNSIKPCITNEEETMQPATLEHSLSIEEDDTIASNSSSGSDSSSPEQEEYFTAHPGVTPTTQKFPPLQDNSSFDHDASDSSSSDIALTPTPRPNDAQLGPGDYFGDSSVDLDGTMTSIGGTSLSRSIGPSDQSLNSSISSVESSRVPNDNADEEGHTSSTIFSAGANVSFSSSAGDEMEDYSNDDVCRSMRIEETDETLNALYDVYSTPDSEEGDHSESFPKKMDLRRSVFSPPEAIHRVFTPPPSSSARVAPVPAVTQARFPNRPLFTPEPVEPENSRTHQGMQSGCSSPATSPRRLPEASSHSSPRQGFYKRVAPTTPTLESSFKNARCASSASISSNTISHGGERHISSTPSSPSCGKGLKPLRLSLSLVDPNASASSVLDFPLPPNKRPSASQRDSIASVSSVAQEREPSLSSRDSLHSTSSVPVSSALPSSPLSSSTSLSLSSNAVNFALLSNNASSSIPLSHSTPQHQHRYYRNNSSSSPLQNQTSPLGSSSPKGGLHPPIGQWDDEEVTIKSPPVRKQAPPRLSLDLASPDSRSTRSKAQDPRVSQSSSTASFSRRNVSPYFNNKEAGTVASTRRSESIASAPLDYQRSSSAALPSISSPPSPGAYLPTPSSARSRSSSPYLVAYSPAQSPFLTSPSSPRPTLLFALASDDPQRVARAIQPDTQFHLQHSGANDMVPTEDGSEISALDYTFQNSDKLLHWRSIIAVLLGFGGSPANEWLENCGLILRYYLQLAREESTRRLLDLIAKSKIFSCLGRLRFEVVGQQRAVELLFKGLRRWEVMKEREKMKRKGASKPVVIMLCGLSAHGKTMMAQKVGEILDFPTHVVDMASVQTSQDLWTCPSTIAEEGEEEEEEESLAAFLDRYRGRRSVVILDEIDKIGSESALWSLLKPWDSGKCSVSPSKTIDVRNTIFIATSNIGQGICGSMDPEIPTEQDYEEIIKSCRVEIIERLGSSVESRIPIVLPFLPFTDDEKIAVAGDALAALSTDSSGPIPKTSETMLLRALEDEILVSGDARELWRVAERFCIDI